MCDIVSFGGEEEGGEEEEDGGGNRREVELHILALWKGSRWRWRLGCL